MAGPMPEAKNIWDVAGQPAFDLYMEAAHGSFHW